MNYFLPLAFLNLGSFALAFILVTNYKRSGGLKSSATCLLTGGTSISPRSAKIGGRRLLRDPSTGLRTPRNDAKILLYERRKAKSTLRPVK